eukprot:3534611-Pyramimonas_sp.AAC.1
MSKSVAIVADTTPVMPLHLSFKSLLSIRLRAVLQVRRANSRSKPGLKIMDIQDSTSLCTI